MYIAFVLLILLLVLLGFEKFYLDRNVGKFKIRILVNGTRGKSTVVKYISAILRQNDIKTFSKITGVIPTYFDSAGESHIIQRRGGARVTEQFKMIGKAAKSGYDAVVLECMSINPELQKLESKSFKPHIYIITNIREDHLEDMGKISDEWVDSICSAIPEDTLVITAEKEYLKAIKTYAAKVNSRVIHTDDIPIQYDECQCNGFVKENIQLAIAASNKLELNSGHFIDELSSEESKEDNYKISVSNFNVKFFNGFAINDVPSARMFLDRFTNSGEKESKSIVLFNSRADRPIRSIRFAELLSNSTVDKVIITGDHKQATRRKLRSLGYSENRIIQWKTKHCKSTGESLNGIIDSNTNLIGLGNIKGDGFEIINSLSKN